MGINGKKLTNHKPKFGNNNLVTKEQDKEIKKEKKLNFSFLHFNQIDYFGIGNCSSKWHTGLLNRLKELEKMTIEEILENNKGNKSLRCHPINWLQKDIPIKRTDLNWLPKEILENDAEFPIIQLSISTSTGRIIGYMDKDSSVFYIVLLDPEHNIQPSEKQNYQIQPTTKGISQYDDLIEKLNQINTKIGKCQYAVGCPITALMKHEFEHNIVYITLDDDFYKNYQELLSKYSLQYILENGIISLME